MNGILKFIKSINGIQYITVVGSICLIFFFKELLESYVSEKISKVEMEKVRLETLISENNKKIDQIKKEITSKDSIINDLEKKDAEILKIFIDNNNQLEKLRRKYEKINDIDRISDADIKSYFAEQYP
jgi:hypothetical protein